MATLTQAETHRLFEYRDGVLYWKIRSANCVNVGDVVGGTNGKNQPYLRFTIKNQRFLVHRIVFLMHHGYMPEVVDHIDGNIQNNSIDNLRSASASQNRANSKLNSNNKSGYKNVIWHKHNKSWHVKVRAIGKNTIERYFADLELAVLFAQEARDLYHGKFARNA